MKLPQPGAQVDDSGTSGGSNDDNNEEAKVLNEVDWGYWLFLLGNHVRCQGLTRL